MITISERAATELQELIARENKTEVALRVWVAGGGCSGLSYGMALDDNAPEPDDNIFDQGGLKILVDPMSLNYMDGSSIEWVDDVLGGGFKVENPNAVSSCGCGSSFATAESGGSAGGCGSCGCKH